MNLAKANRLLSHIRSKENNGTDLQVAVQGVDRIAGVATIFVLWIVNYVTILFNAEKIGNWIGVCWMCTILTILCVLHAKLMKIRDHLIKNKIQDLNELKN